MRAFSPTVFPDIDILLEKNNQYIPADACRVQLQEEKTRNVLPLICFVLIPVWSVSNNLSGPRNYNIGSFQNLLPTDWF